MADFEQPSEHAMRWICAEPTTALGYVEYGCATTRYSSDLVWMVSSSLDHDAWKVIIAAADDYEVEEEGRHLVVMTYDKARAEVDRMLEQGEAGSCLFVVDIDVEWPASLALLFVSLACTMEGEADYYDKLRVLVLGHGEYPQQLRDLFWPYDLEVEEINAREEQDFADYVNFRGFKTMAELGHNIIQDARAHGRYPVVFDLFPSRLESGALRESLSRRGVEWPRFRFPPCPPDAAYHQDAAWRRAGFPVRAEVAGSLRASIAVPNATSFHLVVRNTKLRSVFDCSTGQVVEVKSWLSCAERRSLMAAYTGDDPFRVFVYHCSQEPCSSLREYFDKGPAHTVLDAANSQLSGFLAGACWYAGFHHNIAVAVGAFVDNKLAVWEALRQLKLQGIVDGSAGSVVEMIQGPGWVTFNRVLPRLGYDARLASFVQRGGRSPKVVVVKSQLAAILLMGIDELCQVRDLDGAPLASYRLAPALTSRGFVWRILGLMREWHHSMRFASSESLANMSIAGNQRNMWIGAGPIDLSHLSALRARTCWTAVLEAAGVQDQEDGELTAEDCDSILRDLWAAFVCQVSYCNPHTRDIVDCLSGGRWTRQEEILSGDLVRSESRANRVPGVYYSAKLTADGLSATTPDWMWIPPRIVLEWVRDTHLGDLVGLVATTYPLVQNVEHLNAMSDGFPVDCFFED